MPESVLVTAPNGRQYRFHPGVAQHRGFIYALGHRVYGTASEGAWNANTHRYERAFEPEGKWKFVVSAFTKAPAHV